MIYFKSSLLRQTSKHYINDCFTLVNFPPDLVEVLCHGALFLLLRLLVRVEAEGDLGAERQALARGLCHTASSYTTL
jgi:hypothetical protein